MQSKSKTFFYITMPLISATLTFILFGYVNLKSTEINIIQETHVSSLADQYNRNLQSCFASVSKSKELTRKKCLEEMNKSRSAKLLKEYGYSNLLMSEDDIK